MEQHSLKCAGTYADTLVGSSGLRFGIHFNIDCKASKYHNNITLCPAQLPYNWNGNSYNTGGTYNVTLINNAGCDSIATLNLAVNAVSFNNKQCKHLPIAIALHLEQPGHQQRGNYADTLVGSSGCDSVSTLILIVKAPSASINDITVCPLNCLTAGTVTVTIPAALTMLL
ncbi:MAG: hypothetical protein IPP72_15335 [Chitinophagaceae bacterium]|nr:hypothetical protein [Chitinophagaceae bacterium]